MWYGAFVKQKKQIHANEEDETLVLRSIIDEPQIYICITLRVPKFLLI